MEAEAIPQEQIQLVYNLLKDPSYYSFGLSLIVHHSKLSEKQLRLLEHTSGGVYSKKFSERFNDQINIFKYNDVTYIGLESRRLDYERDKANGSNHVEKMINAGLYDRPRKNKKNQNPNLNQTKSLVPRPIMLVCFCGVFLSALLGFFWRRRTGSS